MNINNIEVFNYKGISHLKFSPKRINLIVGKNNTGKTSLLQALNVLFHNELIQGTNMSSLFNIYSKDKLIKILAETDERKEKIEIREAKEMEVINQFSKDLVKNFLKHLTTKSKKNVNPTLVTELETICEKHIDSNLRNFLLKNSLTLINRSGEAIVYYGIFYDYSVMGQIKDLIDNLIQDLLRLLPPEQNEEWKKHLRSISEYTLYSIRGIVDSYNKLPSKDEVIYISSLVNRFQGKPFFIKKPEDSERLHIIEKIVKENDLISNLESLDFDNVVFSTENGIKAHSFDFLGDGFKSIIGLLWEFSNGMNNTVVLLDEPETYMHPGYIKKLVRFIIDFSKKMNIQFFITTHSPDIIDILLSGDLEGEEKSYIEKELVILRMDKIKDDFETIAEPLNYHEAKETQEDLLLDLRGT